MPPARQSVLFYVVDVIDQHFVESQQAVEVVRISYVLIVNEAPLASSLIADIDAAASDNRARFDKLIVNGTNFWSFMVGSPFV